MTTIKTLAPTTDLTGLVTSFDFTSFPSVHDLMKCYDVINDNFDKNEHGFFLTKETIFGDINWFLTDVTMDENHDIIVKYIEKGIALPNTPYCEFNTGSLRELVNLVKD